MGVMKDTVENALNALLFLVINPLFFAGIFLAYRLGQTRVLNEKSNFNTRFQSSTFEMRHLLVGVLIGLLLSVLTGIGGVTVPLGFIYLLVLITELGYLIFKYKGLSPAYLIGLTLVAGFFISTFWKEDQFFFGMLHGNIDYFFVVLVILLGLMLFVEGHMIFWYAHRHASPSLSVSKRGRKIGKQIIKRVWLLPVLIFIPVGDVRETVQWEFLYTWQDTSWVPIFFPFLIGINFEVLSRTTKEACHKIGRRIFILAVLVTLVGIASYFETKLVLVAAALAICGRMWIAFVAQKSELQELPIYTTQDGQATIIGVVPGSVAANMKLTISDQISSINGIAIHSQDDLVSAVQSSTDTIKVVTANSYGEKRAGHFKWREGQSKYLGLFVADYEKRRSRQASDEYEG